MKCCWWHLARAFRLSHRCHISRGRSARATCPCAVTAAAAAGTRAAGSAAGSEASCNDHGSLTYYFVSGVASWNDLSFTSPFVYVNCFKSNDSTDEALFFFIFIFYIYCVYFNILVFLYTKWHVYFFFFFKENIRCKFFIIENNNLTLNKTISFWLNMFCVVYV